MEPVPPIVSQLHKALTDKFRSKQALDSDSVDDPLEAARLSLDKEIEVAELAFRAYEAYSLHELEVLRLRRNRLAPIFHLPNETLSSAFCFAVWSYDKYTRGIQFLLTISSVCRAWRGIALEFPKLWTRLEWLPLLLFSLFLDRSKQAPLDIVFDKEYEPPEGNNFSEYLALISPHVRQWKTFIFRYPSFDEIMPSLLLPTPHLEALVLDCGPRSRFQGSDSLELFPHPFADHTPSLRKLTLGAIFVPFTHPIYSNLTKLELKDIECEKLDLMRELFQVFSEASPLLETLHLRSLEFTFSSTAGPSDSADLPRLQTLGLQYLEPAWVTTHFLSHLTIPPSATLEIIGDSELGGDISTILPPYSSTHPNLPNLSSITALIIHAQEYLCVVSGHTVQKELFSFEFTADPEVQMAAIVSDLGRVFPMPLLNYIQFCDFHLGDSVESNLELAATCRDFLNRRSTIKKLAFYDSHKSMLDFLFTSTPPLVCPQLEYIIFERCPLSPERLIEAVKSRTTSRKTALKGADAQNDNGSEANDRRLLRVDILGCPRFTKAHLSALRKRVRVEYKEKAPRFSDESE
ncbi:hypothetical protein BOTBODRAFT_170539 [Botryobasidium botryosum FD-172 SS1]|uniref:Uncharacterized protein n=1 Tax=Botryobasidium botryosum (strain FD-172 SS1) TaxID=930990 RepID=A0A067MV16_BOTB1|nr:hypothetical protein BOTBODRAFT_170539 [Botryobasidium botryosum FD-172 SS1]